ERRRVQYVRRDDGAGRRVSGNTQNALVLNRNLGPAKRNCLHDRTADFVWNSQPPAQREGDLRSRAGGRVERFLQLFLETFALREGQSTIGELLPVPFTDLLLRGGVGANGKRVIELVAVDAVLIKMVLIVDLGQHSRFDNLVYRKRESARIDAR